MKRLEFMKDKLINCVQDQLGDLASADAKELGEAVDMIKDLSEAIYYCTITEAMEEKEYHKREKYYTEPYYRDMDSDYGRMYYTPGMNSTSGNGGMNSSSSRNYPIEIRDSREGRSPMTRKMYMEHKELHQDKSLKMKDLEKYVHELTDDIMEMIEDSSPEEKQVLQKKIAALSTKIV